MSRPLEDYALIGDCETAALVSRDGSIDWLCWPRFDSGACFAALLGTREHGHWTIAAADRHARISRRYCDDTLILETRIETDSGGVTVVDFMPPRGKNSDIVRLVRGNRGSVRLQTELVLRFDYGLTVPWVSRLADGAIRAVAGPDMVTLHTPVPLRGEGLTTVGEFDVTAGTTVPFVLTHSASHLPPPDAIDPIASLGHTETFWTEWVSANRSSGDWANAVTRSTITSDAGLWEVRGGARQFTYSKVMAWVAFDRGIHAVETLGLDGPLDEWRAVREEIHADVCVHGFDSEIGSFVQSYGSKELDASLLLIPSVGFLPPTDSRVRGTIAAVEERLFVDGFLRRYDTRTSDDGLPGGEGAFLACSFWLADAYVLMDRFDDARRLFERLLGLCNDVGLLSEEYDTRVHRLVGNFPQAFSHIALANTAHNLARAVKPARQRSASQGLTGCEAGPRFIAIGYAEDGAQALSAPGAAAYQLGRSNTSDHPPRDSVRTCRMPRRR